MVTLVQVEDGVVSLLSRVKPYWLRKFFASSLFGLYSYLKRCKSVIFELKLHIYSVSGRKKNTGDSICLLFIGREKFPLFLADMLFDEEPNVKREGSLFVWQLHALKRDNFIYDAILVSVDRFYNRWLRKADLFVIPHLVHMIVDISSSMNDFYRDLSNSAKADIRKVRNRGFSYDVVSSRKLLKYFYNAMYLPLIESRFSDKPLYTPPFSFFILLHLIGYRLLLVKNNNGDYVSGCYFERGDDILFSRYNGVINGDINLIKKGVESALYYYLIEWAKQKDFSYIDFGYCRPFKNDGVFRYKKKWGARIEQSKGSHTPDVFGFKIVKKDSILHEFFKQNPFYCINRNNTFFEYKGKE